MDTMDSIKFPKLIPRQDHPFGYYPFGSLNMINKTNLSEMDGLKKYIFFYEKIQNTLYILPTVEGGSAPSEIDLYDGSVFKSVCLEDDIFSDISEIENENEMEQKIYSSIYFTEQGNILWCIKNTDLLMELD
jgi:hypothetical protein